MADEALTAICVEHVLPLFNCPPRRRRSELSPPGWVVLVFIIFVIILASTLRLPDAGRPGEHIEEPANSITLGSLPTLRSGSNSTSPSNATIKSSFHPTSIDWSSSPGVEMGK
ncbi:hypothetical protein GGR58DRAFT_494638 [Xylaria digitata]|nr:hypothetical protein GGR58DRAFT_494638 [Xylaria digitata]